jgi:Protein of unknown function (DUF2889)
MNSQLSILGTRQFQVNYSRLSETLWKAESELIDELHHIKTCLEISTDDEVVKKAEITFLRKPLVQCSQVELLAQKLVGTKVKDLGFKLFRTFLGKKGCSQAYLLFGLAGPGFTNVYDLNRVQDKLCLVEEYNLRMKNDCLAHKIEHETRMTPTAH